MRYLMVLLMSVVFFATGCATYSMDGMGGGYVHRDKQTGRYMAMQYPGVAAGNQPYPGGLVSGGMDYIMSLNISDEQKAQMIQGMVDKAENNRRETNTQGWGMGGRGGMVPGGFGGHGGMVYNHNRSRTGYLVNSTRETLQVQIEGMQPFVFGPGDRKMLTVPTDGNYYYTAYVVSEDSERNGARLKSRHSFPADRDAFLDGVQYDFVHNVR